MDVSWHVARAGLAVAALLTDLGAMAGVVNEQDVPRSRLRNQLGDGPLQQETIVVNTQAHIVGLQGKQRVEYCDRRNVLQEACQSSMKHARR